MSCASVRNPATEMSTGARTIAVVTFGKFLAIDSVYFGS